MTRVRIYPGFNALYYGFYLKGIRAHWKTDDIDYSTRGFPKFGHHCLAWAIEGPRERRIYISAGDGPGFNEEGLEWCDIYAKVKR